MKQEEVVFQRRNRLKKHFINTSNVLLYGYQQLPDGAKITFQVIDSFDWESKETKDSKGYAFPAIQTIARIRAGGERTIYRHVKELEEAGLLTRVRRRNKPSILIIEDVSERESQKYLNEFVDKTDRGGGSQNQPPPIQSPEIKNDLLISSTAKNGSSHESSQLPKMADAYMNKKDESKENEINVNENLSIKRKGETKSLRDLLMQYDLQIPRKTKNEATVQRKTSKTNGVIDKNQRDYLASEMAEKLDDQKSLGAFRVIAERVPQSVVFEVLSSIKETAREGKIRVSRGALFVDIIKGYCDSHGIELGFGTKETSSDIIETQRGMFTTS